MQLFPRVLIASSKSSFCHLTRSPISSSRDTPLHHSPSLFSAAESSSIRPSFFGARRPFQYLTISISASFPVSLASIPHYFPFAPQVHLIVVLPLLAGLRRSNILQLFPSPHQSSRPSSPVFWPFFFTYFSWYKHSTDIRVLFPFFFFQTLLPYILTLQLPLSVAIAS